MRTRSIWLLTLPFMLLAGLFLSVVVAAPSAIANTRQALPLSAASTALSLPAVGTEVTGSKVALGRWLFFDPRLSADGRKSCASCHRPENAFTDPERLSTGVHGRKGRRRSQPLIDVARAAPFFWDGRATTLVEQAKGPLVDPLEMGNDPSALVRRLNGVAGYRSAFATAFGTPAVTFDRIAEAIAAYEATLVSGRRSLRDLRLEGAAERGLMTFLHGAGCGSCHLPTDGFSDRRFHNLGVGWDEGRSRGRRSRRGFRDPGRYEITRADADTGAFKTPMLFDLRRRAPYMHDGSLATLEEVIEFYDRGGNQNPWLSREMKPLGLSAAEKADLIAFLEALGSHGPVDPGPTTFPQ